MSVTQPSGASIHYRYDHNGNKILEKNNLGQGLEYQYDSLNQVTRYQWNKVGKIEAIIDPLEAVENFRYDRNRNIIRYASYRK